MSYIERTQLKNVANTVINPSTEDTSTLILNKLLAGINVLDSLNNIVDFTMPQGQLSSAESMPMVLSVEQEALLQSIVTNTAAITNYEIVGLKNSADTRINPATQDTLITLLKEDTFTGSIGETDANPTSYTIQSRLKGLDAILTQIESAQTNGNQRTGIINIGGAQINPATNEALVDIKNKLDAGIQIMDTTTAVINPATEDTLNLIYNRQADGTQKSIVRGGAKGATTAADITSTAISADHQAIDAILYDSGGRDLDFRQENENWNAADHGILIFGRDIESTPNKYRAISLNAEGDQMIVLSEINGAEPSVSNGAVDTGTLRVTIANNSTGVVGLNAGSNLIGKVSIDQTTDGTTNKVYVGNTVNVASHAVTNAGTFAVQNKYVLPLATNVTSTLTLTNASTAYQITEPTSDFLVTYCNTSDTDMYWGFATLTSGGVLLPKNGGTLTLKCAANNSPFFYCASAGKVLAYTTTLI